MPADSRQPVVPPNAADIEELAHEAFRQLPEPFRRAVDGVVIRVDEFPDEETCEDMGLESPFDVLGLYRGVALDERSNFDVARDLDMIFLYRRPMLDYWAETHEPLQDIVRHVLIHEIGHHLGLSDEEMETIEESDG